MKRRTWASMVMTALAWDLKAWFALSVPERPRHRAAHREQERQLRRTEFKRFVNAIILMPCRIARGGRRLIYRLLSWDEWQGVFLRVVYASRCRGDDESEPGSGRPGPQGPRELRGRRGGDDGTAGPATMRRHPASPITVRSVSMGAGSSSASLKPRLFKG